MVAQLSNACEISGGFVPAMRLPYLHVDDLYLTGFCAERCGFPRKKHPFFTAYKKELNEVTKEQILVHWMDETMKRGMFDKLNNNGTTCANTRRFFP